jgi:hypothetical protein
MSDNPKGGFEGEGASDEQDVEAHGPHGFETPAFEEPSAASDEEPDVEAHGPHGFETPAFEEPSAKFEEPSAKFE